MARIGFIGLGNMGGGMAANLAKAGHDVRAFDLSADALARAKAAGVTTARWRMPAHASEIHDDHRPENWTEAHAASAARAREELATKDRPLSD